MSKKVIWSIVAVVALVVTTAFLVATKASQFKVLGEPPPAPPPEVVTAIAVKQDVWENTIRASATVAPVQGVTLGAETAGKVVDISFESGAKVKAGDLLLKLESSSEEAQLESAMSTLANAKTNSDRAKTLLASTTISRAEFDAVDTQFKQATSQVENLRAIIAKKSVRAPFDGRLGIRLVNLGQILREGDAVTTLQTLDPIYANFSLPQQRVSQVSPGLTVRVTSDAAPGDVFEGKVNALNPDVDAPTRSVRVQVTLANKQEKLRPGMFAAAEVILPATTNVLAIPATSVLYAPFGDSVFIIDEKKDEKTGKVSKVLRQQLIRIGRARGDFVEVTEGIKAGETVVTTGVFKLRTGMEVTIDNTLAPEAKLNPKPRDA